MTRPVENVVAFYNKHGTCEQWIKEGKGAIRWTRLSCRSFSANAVRLQLHALAYNLGNFPHRRTATAASHVNSMRRSVSRVRQNPQEKCVLIAKSSALSTFDLASACLGAVRRRAGGSQADGSSLPRARCGRRLDLNRQQSGGCRVSRGEARHGHRIGHRNE
jgi:hypothetical protein